MRLRFPKPPKREAKAKSPVKRTSRPRKQRKGSRAALKRKCDKVWSLIIRAPGKCWLEGKDHVRCGGVLQGAHNFGRGHHSVRHELWNGSCTCQGHHVYYTHHSEAWQQLLRNEWGPELYQARFELAQSTVRPDYPSILVQLTERAKELGVA